MGRFWTDLNLPQISPIAQIGFKKSLKSAQSAEEN